MNFVKITEVGPRDGLQNEKAIVPTDAKFEFIQALAKTGLQHIEATSFVKKEWVPQMGDAEELTKLIFGGNPIDPEIQLSSLTPNIKGYEKAVSLGFKEVAVFTASSESFTKKNINKTIDESITAFQEIFQRAKEDKVKVRGYISTVIACPYEGKISPEKTLTVAKKLLEAGVYEISLGETIGVAVPSEVESLLNVLLKEIPSRLLAGHFHDTYGMAISNVKQSLNMGLRSFDSSAGGLGGCPYAKGASGNLATEDLVYFLEREGYHTGVDLDALVNASSLMEKALNRPLLSRTYVAKSKAKESS
ncbi:hydroxymethylglutaryl-CoA lyase [Leptospira kobayashii]|uniref:Hydroxymethylglutaryl-CoA lyase n=1 Tax=Leptospira kobayashii TaxID=1917830 RepID=A0ABM7UJV4_9LEPT|nr:hydroxymethylglutaryl-CoA lyase [Leptospira kobayashii]BDA79088.1 hydroxymethylglutaryl-CoA lyase [Leptospira kobayashii]